MTKKELKEHRAAWTRALSEGRIVRLFDGMTLKECLTAEGAARLAADCLGVVVAAPPAAPGPKAAAKRTLSLFPDPPPAQRTLFDTPSPEKGRR